MLTAPCLQSWFYPTGGMLLLSVVIVAVCLSTLVPLVKIAVWRLQILEHAAAKPCHVAQTYRYFGIWRTAYYRWKKRFDR